MWIYAYYITDVYCLLYHIVYSQLVEMLEESEISAFVRSSK